MNRNRHNMLARRTILKVFGIIPLSLLVDRASIFDTLQKLTAFVDYDSLDGRIREALMKGYGFDLDQSLVRYMREKIQLYYHSFYPSDYCFKIERSDKDPVTNEMLDKTISVPCGIVKGKMDSLANELGYRLYRAPYTISQYRELDNFVENRLQKKLGIEMDPESAKAVREWAQLHHLVYQERKTVYHSFKDFRKYPYEVGSLSGTFGKIRECEIGSGEVITWLREWEQMKIV